MTSVQNCSTAPAMMGPRQTTGSVSCGSSTFMLIICMPPALLTGRIKFSPPRAPSCTPNICGTLGPVTSASSMAVRWPRRCISEASSPVTRLLPTPPLPLTTAITRPTALPSCSGLRKLSGLRLEQFSAQLEQS